MRAAGQGQIVVPRSLQLRRQSLIREILRVNGKIAEVTERMAVLKARIRRLTPAKRKAA
jgi:hypothetical protein